MADIAVSGDPIDYRLRGKALHMQIAGIDFNLRQLWYADGTASWLHDHSCTIFHHPAVDDAD